jgi:hypothetical protein
MDLGRSHKKFHHSTESPPFTKQYSAGWTRVGDERVARRKRFLRSGKALNTVREQRAGRRRWNGRLARCL